jgi:hypothetical protein
MALFYFFLWKKGTSPAATTALMAFDDFYFYWGKKRTFMR